jgi:hypothetical protein
MEDDGGRMLLDTTFLGFAMVFMNLLRSPRYFAAMSSGTIECPKQ